MHHRRGLRRWIGDEEAARVGLDYETAGLPERMRVLLRYVDKLTVAPASMVVSDIEALRQVGFADEDILAIVEVAAYYAYANRIVDGLGVELEEES